jgi:hypothetical protein
MKDGKMKKKENTEMKWRRNGERKEVKCKEQEVEHLLRGVQ